MSQTGQKLTHAAQQTTVHTLQTIHSITKPLPDHRHRLFPGPEWRATVIAVGGSPEAEKACEAMRRGESLSPGDDLKLL
jgi:hypothetical protein